MIVKCVLEDGLKKNLPKEKLRIDLTELKKDKYINHIVECSPKDQLTVDNILEKFEYYLIS